MSRAGLCTCHQPPAPMTQESPQHEWQHDHTAREVNYERLRPGDLCDPSCTVDCGHCKGNYPEDGTFAEVFHVHVYSSSSDCDGPLDRSHTYQVVSITDCEGKDDLWRKVLGFELHPSAIHQTVEIDGEQHRAHFNQRTDEGYHNAEVVGCDSPDCAHEGASQRDHYAEAAGY